MRDFLTDITIFSMKKNENAIKLLDFIKKSPSPFHAVKNIGQELEKADFIPLFEDQPWNLQPGKSYYVTRNDSSLIAFKLPEAKKITSFLLTASHSDSPTFKIKENSELKESGAVSLNVEKYGGMLIQSWFDRPLSLAGRLILREKSSDKSLCLSSCLVNIDRDLLLIPNLAIHMNREANEGWKIDLQKEIRPVLSLNENQTLLSLLAENEGRDEKDILSYDLFLYNRTNPVIWGAENEFISSPKLDDLECAWSCLQGFIEAVNNSSINKGENTTSSLSVYCLFDNEEVGSASRQGADSNFLKDTFARISEKTGLSSEDYKIALSKSLMLSADNAHALHPNYSEKSDPVNRPKINGGVVIKYNASQKYTSDALSSACFKEVCKKAGIPFQIFTNNSNQAGGSTLGNISQTQLSISSVDIGLAQWAMHSSYESAGCKDLDYMIKAVCEFYKSDFCLKK